MALGYSHYANLAPSPEGAKATLEKYEKPISVVQTENSLDSLTPEQLSSLRSHQAKFDKERQDKLATGRFLHRSL